MKKFDLNKFERAIAYVAPGLAFRRMQNRIRIDAALSYSGANHTRISAPARSSYSTTGVRALANGKQRSMGDRAVDLDHNNPLATAILDRLTDITIGAGSQIQAMTDIPKFNAAAERGWRQFWKSPEVSGRFSGPELERLAFRSADRWGDIGTVLLDEKKVQLLPGGLIEGEPGKANIVDGVELAEDGSDRPVGYWRKYKKTTNAPWSYTRYDAKDFILYGNFRDVTEVRGETVFAQTFNYFDQLDGYLEAKVIQNRMAAACGVAITSKSPQATINALGTTTNAQGQQQSVVDFEPGGVAHLSPDEDIKIIQGAMDAGQVDIFVRTLARIIGSPMGIPAEFILLDFASMNLSSARAVMGLAYHRAKARRVAFHAAWNSRIYQWWLSKTMKEKDGIFRGIDFPDEPWAHRVISRPLPLMDPKTEYEAAGLAIDLQLLTHSQACMEIHGTDFVDDHIPVAIKDRDALKGAGLVSEKSAGTRQDIQPNNTSPKGNA